MAPTPTSTPRRTARLLLTAALAALGVACATDRWNTLHSAGKAMSADRPECPVKWDTVPLFGVKDTITDGTPNRKTIDPGSGGIAVLGMNGPKVTGPITDVPEFHDCQKFIIDANGVRSYSALFAIFAASSLDSLVGSLGQDNVVWQSGNTPVATVDQAGRVTAVGAGIASITATSVQHPAIKAVATIVVKAPTGPPPASAGNLYVPPGGGANAAIFISQKLQLLTVMSTPTTSTSAVGEIYTYGAGDARLGIGQNFSCLYLYFDAQGAMQARIVPARNLGTEWDACVKAFDPSALATDSPLKVIRASGGPSSDYPAAARWDWDPVNNQQSIGIKCGAGWCQIGTAGPKGSFAPSASYPVSDNVSTEEARVLGIKGWYDEQFLGITDTNGNTTPTTMKGTVIPDPALNTVGFSPGSWVPVGYFALDAGNAPPEQLKYYKTKFNLDVVPVRAPLASMNQIEMCHGTRAECHVPLPEPGTTGCQPETHLGTAISMMWSRITSATQHDIRYRCITRRVALLPSGVTVPATARLRWLADDETVWEACTQGCCEVEIVK